MKSWWRIVSDVAVIAVEEIRRYVRFLILLFAGLSALAIVLLLICLPLAKAGSGREWILTVWSIMVGIEAVIFLCFAWPVLWAGKVIADKFPGLNLVWMIRLFAAAGFWALLLGIYFALVPIGQNPRAVLLLVLVTGAAALGSFGGWVKFSRPALRGLLTMQFVLVFIMITFAAFFPRTARRMANTLPHLDAQMASGGVPNAIAIPPVGLLELVDRATGEPIVWYYRSPVGEYELFNRSGFHSSGTPLKLVNTDQERQEVLAWVKNYQQNLADTARKKADEAEAVLAKAQAEAEARAAAQAKATADAEAAAKRKTDADAATARAAVLAAEKAKKDFYDHQGELIANGAAPNLGVSINFTQDRSGFQLILENKSDALIKTSEIRLVPESGSVVPYPLQLELPSKQKTWYRYDRDLRGIRRLDFVCDGFKEPYQILLE